MSVLPEAPQMPQELANFQPEQAPEQPAQKWQTLSPGERNSLGQRLSAQIDASIKAQGEARRSRWVQIKKLHDIDESTISMTFVEGMKPFVFPLLRQKCDRIVGSCHGGLTAIYPAIQVVDESDGLGGNVADVERAMENLSKLAGRDKAIKQGARTAFITNRSVWFIYPKVDNGQVTELCWKNLHPQNVVVYPPEVPTWDEAQTVGHRRFEQYWHVRQKMKAGQNGPGEYFLDDDVKGGADPNKHPNQEPDTKPKGKKTEPPTPAAGMVEVFELVSWVDLDNLASEMESGDGNYSRYVCTVAKESKKLLKIEPYTNPDLWYIPVSLVEDCEDQVWPDDSVGQTVQQQQLAACDIATIIGQGSVMSAAGPMFVSGGTLIAKQAEKYEPATIYYLDGDAKVFAFPSTFNPSNLFAFLELLEVNVDSLTGITRQSTGENTPDRETATSTVIRNQAQAEAKDNYSDQMAAALEKAAKLLFGYLTYHLPDLKKVYGSQIPIKDGVIPPQQEGQPPMQVPAQLRLKMMSPRFEVTGRSGTNTPSVLIQKLQQALQVAMMQGSEWDPMKIAAKIMYALELPFSVDGLKKTPEQMQAEAQRMQNALPPGVFEKLSLDLKNFLPGEHAQLMEKLGIQPDDPSGHPQSFGGQAVVMLSHAVQGLIDGSVTPQAAKELVQHILEIRNGGKSSVPDAIKQREADANRKEA